MWSHGQDLLLQALKEQQSLIQNQPLLTTIYFKPPIITYKSGKFLKDTNLTLRLLCEVTTKTIRGVCAGLSLTCSDIFYEIIVFFYC